ncbi:hypothetical protein MAR_028334 [Mya arenaria]|uniref:Secreted protein n=1 Tax=Mya arenaria TaxID=6604 RepID=A0ABY7DGU0_MYAAR|nr:hypothetical protein MAR_028334 [Mya arenaria]
MYLLLLLLLLLLILLLLLLLLLLLDTEIPGMAVGRREGTATQERHMYTQKAMGHREGTWTYGRHMGAVWRNSAAGGAEQAAEGDRASDEARRQASLNGLVAGKEWFVKTLAWLSQHYLCTRIREHGGSMAAGKKVGPLDAGAIGFE